MGRKEHRLVANRCDLHSPRVLSNLVARILPGGRTEGQVYGTHSYRIAAHADVRVLSNDDNCCSLVSILGILNKLSELCGLPYSPCLPAFSVAVELPVNDGSEHQRSDPRVA
jgi:hypothetical protein